MSRNRIPIIDLFAGPGGLGEGFSRYRGKGGSSRFETVLSIEKDRWAYRTLELRSFFRQFADGHAPDEYYMYLEGLIAREELFDAFPEESARAKNEAWCAELGSKKFPPEVVRERIYSALKGAKIWALLGGPPCQAYSLVGRSRMLGEDRKKKDEENRVRYEDDHRHFLYKHYLRIIADHRPPVFVMENVKGLLSATLRGSSTITRIFKDLRAPRLAVYGEQSSTLAYQLFPLNASGLAPLEIDPKPQEFLVEAEHFGIPQCRHRLFLVGVRADMAKLGIPSPLKNGQEPIPAFHAISDLPQIRSKLSKNDTFQLWQDWIISACDSKWIWESNVPQEVRDEIFRALQHTPTSNVGGPFVPRRNPKLPKFAPEWFHDPKLQGWVNHEARGHMAPDLHRYLFAAAFAKAKGRSPKLKDFPQGLLPDHQNVDKNDLKNTIFADRFRVQLATHPSTTITSHAAKDGHYYIHPDPRQCRSLTVREAARLQTFPDNYFFEGGRTEQFKQVGNAVPPLLAVQIAAVISDLFIRTATL